MDKTKNPKNGGGAPRGGSPLALGKYIIFSAALFLLISICGSAAFLYSMRQITRENKGQELVKLLELERMKLENSVGKEIAIVLKMASSPLIRRHFENPGDPELRRMAEGELEAYRKILTGAAFWINDADRMFHFNDRTPYPINPALPENYWYPKTLYETDMYNLNINYSPDLNETNLWINAPVFNDSGKAVGMVGTGVNLSAFIEAIYSVYKSHNKARFYFFNAAEEITGAEDVRLVDSKKSIRDELGAIGPLVAAVAKTLGPSHAETFAVQSGQIAMIPIPALEWYAVAILPDNIGDFYTPMTTVFLLGILVVAIILVLSNIFIARLLGPLRETLARLENASQAKTEFLAKMSHEIRTPMNAIMGIAQIQQQKPNLPDEFKGAFDKIYNSSTLLLGIINDILDMSKIETGKLELHPIDYDVPSLIDDSVQYNIARIGSKPVVFKLFVDEKLPARLFGDEVRLKQIMNNMLSNAFKYTDRGSVTLSVRHAMDGDDVVLTLKIADTGQGISEEDLKLLFAEYERFNIGANRNTEGTGLGLNITQRLVAMMGGRIDVESVYGKGTTFTITVRQGPIAECGVIGAELSEKLRNFTFESLQHNRQQAIERRVLHGTVLVVDDVDVNLVVAEGLLSPYGLKVEKASSGFTAIDLVKNGRMYDIIFMDHMMPKMDGVEATKNLRAIGYDGIIVALTANAIVGNEEMFIKSGFNGFISKPVDIREMDAILNRFIRVKHPEAAAKMRSDAALTQEPPNDSQEPRRVQPVQMNERFMKALRNDVGRAVAAIRQTVAGGDMKLFTTTVHGLKSGLAVVGENEKSKMAHDLEIAGRNGDTDFINANYENFIKALEELIKDEQ